MKMVFWRLLLKLIYSEKATTFCKISTLFLCTIHTAKREFLKILWTSQNIWTLLKNIWYEAGGEKNIIWVINLCTNLLQNLEMHKMGFTKLLCNNIVWQILDVCNRNNNKKYSRPKTSFLIENVEIERQTSRQSVAQSLEQIRSHKKGLKVYQVASKMLQVLNMHLKKFFYNTATLLFWQISKIISNIWHFLAKSCLFHVTAS